MHRTVNMQSVLSVQEVYCCGCPGMFDHDRVDRTTVATVQVRVGLRPWLHVK